MIGSRRGQCDATNYKKARTLKATLLVLFLETMDTENSTISRVLSFLTVLRKQVGIKWKTNNDDSNLALVPLRPIISRPNAAALTQMALNHPFGYVDDGGEFRLKHTRHTHDVPTLS